MDRLDGRPEKYGLNDIEMMKALIDGGTPIKDMAESHVSCHGTFLKKISFKFSRCNKKMKHQLPGCIATFHSNKVLNFSTKVQLPYNYGMISK